MTLPTGSHGFSPCAGLSPHGSVPRCRSSTSPHGGPLHGSSRLAPFCRPLAGFRARGRGGELGADTRRRGRIGYGLCVPRFSETLRLAVTLRSGARRHSPDLVSWPVTEAVGVGADGHDNVVLTPRQSVNMPRRLLGFVPDWFRKPARNPPNLRASDFRLYEGRPLVKPYVSLLTPQVPNCRVSAALSILRSTTRE